MMAYSDNYKTNYVEVYRNLHNGKYSLRCAQSKLVLGHANAVLLEQPSFRVSQAGRRRVIREMRKNVHAVIRGVLVSATGFDSFKGRGIVQTNNHSKFTDAVDVGDMFTATYNPYKYDSFVRTQTEQPISHADYAVLNHGNDIMVLSLPAH